MITGSQLLQINLLFFAFVQICVHSLWILSDEAQPLNYRDLLGDELRNFHINEQRFLPKDSTLYQTSQLAKRARKNFLTLQFQKNYRTIRSRENYTLQVPTAHEWHNITSNGQQYEIRMKTTK